MFITNTQLNSNLATKQDASTAITTSNIANQSVKSATSSGSCTGNAATATKLANARTLQTNLASTSAVGFDGSANKTIGVTGTLPLANGGTGATTASNARTNLGLGAAATKAVDTSAKSGSSNLITSGAVYSGLSGKANSSHTHNYLPLTGGTIEGSLLTTSILATNNNLSVEALLFTRYIARNDAKDDYYINFVRNDNSAYAPIRCSDVTKMSSEKVKENIVDLTYEEANKLLDVNVVSFDYKESFGGKKNNVGVIAEQVKDFIPYAVNIPKNYDESSFDESKGIHQDIIGVDYTHFVPYLIKMVQIQQSKINELEERLYKLEK